MVRMFKLKFFSLILIIIPLFFSGFVSAEDIRIALRANKGAQKGLAKWQATADYLSTKIPGYRFILVPFENNSALNQAISLGAFHFCITNPASGIEHKIRYGAQPLATLVNKRQGQGYSQFGSVIFARADRHDVNTLQDLKGKMFTAVDELGFGGWRVAWFELLENNINPYTDFTELRFGGGKQQNVVYDVRDKKVAAGSVRTDMLERMAASGEIDMRDFKVLAQKKSKNFPFLHSTKLYPEWMFSSVTKMDDKLKTNVIEALFSIQKYSTAAKNGKYIGWISPLDYTPVDDLLKALKVGPYNIATMDAYKRLVSQYGMVVVAIIIFVSLLILVILYVLGLNKKILQAKELLKNESELSRKLEIQLLHSKRIESLGKLTGGIAHDFNNMLASILGYTELALNTDKIKDDKKLTRYLSQVVEASGKSAELVAQMLTFSKSEADNDKKEDITANSFINNVKQLLQPIIPTNISLNINEPNKELFINVNSATMTQVLMSLYLNAKDAIENKNGIITINSKAVSFNSSDIICNSCHQNIMGDYIEISVEDDGCGIQANTIEHLFEPFFTTKEVGKGTGMGLSVVHGITHKHNGHILIDSEEGKGTIVKILLPKIEVKKNIELQDNNKDASINKNKHIVLVDDESSFTVYLSELLKFHGYTVTSFNDSQEALLYMQENYDNVDFILTDQIMPNLTGFELSKKVLGLNGEMPIILCSGYSEGLYAKVKSELNTVIYMDKPIQSDKLIKTISSLLR